MHDKILGCLLGAAVGDAMGAATEMRSSNQINEYFGGKVVDFQKPPQDTFARGREAGQVTDAFSIPYILLKHLIKAKGKASKELAEQALLDWAAHEDWFEAFAGMTTRKMVHKLKCGKDPSRSKLFSSDYFALSSNGAATKAFPLGLLHPGKVDSAIRDTIAVSQAVHNDAYSISGACAVSAAVSTALVSRSVYEVVQAGLYGAEMGEVKGREVARDYPGPSVFKRMRMAIGISLKARDADSCCKELAACIGNGPQVAETVPVAFGLFVANKGETMSALFNGVNIGNETSAIASIIGAIAGALNGAQSITAEYLSVIERQNKMNLVQLAKELEAII
ncbi:MAG: ADP-ribosylglycohydrolase family protein [Thermoanaerobacterales bacterium]|nr:ADP-ribosylglycohydrolase family protein [Thermoanaerobacterales bacterium]